MTAGGEETDAVVWSADPRKAARRRRLVRRLPPLLTGIIRVIHASLRYRVDVPPPTARLFESGKPFVLCFWHGRMVILSQIYRTQFAPAEALWVLISHHWDGELIARTVRPFGVRGVRGSSTRGGAQGYAELVARLRSGDRVGITPDGPKGPRYRIVGSGVLRLARDAAVPVVPVSWYARPCVRLQSWDRFQIPLPFARVSARFGEPMNLGPGEGMEVQRRRLEVRMNLLNHETAARVRGEGIRAFGAVVCRVALGVCRAVRRGGSARIGGETEGPAGARPADSAMPGSVGWGAERRREPVWVCAATERDVRAAGALASGLRSLRPGVPVVVYAACADAEPEVRLPGEARADARRRAAGGLGTTRPGVARPRLLVVVGGRVAAVLLRSMPQRIPVAWVGGDVSGTGCARAGRFRSVFRALLDDVALLCMRTQEDAWGIVRLGADPRRVYVSGEILPAPGACDGQDDPGEAGAAASCVGSASPGPCLAGNPGEGVTRVVELLGRWVCDA